MGVVPNTTGRTGRPPVTSRAEILSAARRLIDQDGWEKLTIRRLASELGIGPTTLYHHVRDKEDLLLLLLNEYAEQIPLPELPAGPAERVVAAATTLHDSLAAWPWAAEVLTVDGFVGLLRTAALRPVEAILAAAVDAGRTPDEAVEVFRAIWYYTVGEILVRARSGRKPAGVDFGGFDPVELPHLAAVGPRWPVIAARDSYPAGLRALVAGLLQRGVH